MRTAVEFTQAITGIRLVVIVEHVVALEELYLSGHTIIYVASPSEPELTVNQPLDEVMRRLGFVEGG